MAMNEIIKGTELYGGLMDDSKLYLIVRGSIKVRGEGASFVLKNGDVAGVLNLCQSEHTLTYETLENCSVVEYSYSIGDIRSFFSENKDIVKYLMNSLYRQLEYITQNYKALKMSLFRLREFMVTSYEDYEAFCEAIGASPSDMDSLGELLDMSTVELLPEWLTGYHAGMTKLLKEQNSADIDPDLLTGVVISLAGDAEKMVRISGDIINRKEDLLALLLGESGGDLFELYEMLYVRAVKAVGIESEEVKEIYAKLREIMLMAEDMGVGDESYYAKRLTQYDETMNEAGEYAESAKENAEIYGEGKMGELSDSLNRILNYSSVSDELKDSFEKNVNDYKKTVNKSSGDEKFQHLRKSITKEFYEIYEDCFLKSVSDKAIPIPVLMFLEFGYVDEELCGIENAIFLSQVAKHMPTEPQKGVYSCREWLLSVYNGENDPGRNEFDMDYAEYLRDEAHANRITKEEEKALFKDPVERVKYEIQNVFTQVNKMTTGRITTFCPVLSEHNFLKKAKSMLVSSGQILKNLDDIRRIDFSAFYRTIVYANPESGIAREFINVEILPNVILMPNIGSRAVMWQEIEGRRRTTPARMFMSALSLEDIYPQLLKMTGNFRWEMCKRVQGSRWNDISERSLTSEYFDYVQYYRKNSELSAEVKEKVRNELIRAKNSFREMFIRDYVTYIQFESQGSPRLNKVSRAIMLNNVPLRKEYREKLMINPMYRSIIEKYEVKQKAKAHRMDNLILKIKNSGKEVPEEIENESRFINA